MLRQSLRWRAQWEVDGALRSWTPPEVVRLFYPYGISGVDKDGAPGAPLVPSVATPANLACKFA